MARLEGMYDDIDLEREYLKGLIHQKVRVFLEDIGIIGILRAFDEVSLLLEVQGRSNPLLIYTGLGMIISPYEEEVDDQGE